ncbi:MAG: peptidase T [Erysipelotrichaceae bacterium]|nr:peptidase T [Erysipelotrichaceae bacterium]
MLIDKLLDYVSYDTTSHEGTGQTPSTEGQWALAKHLKKQLEQLGLEDVVLDEHCYVYGYLPGDPDYLTIGLNSHMDTSEQASGKDIKPRIIENYDGKDIVLSEGIVSSVERFPELKDYVGKTLVVTDGTTLLGADDKAGVAEIMEVLETLVNDPSIKHGPIRVCFSPDEEIGGGTSYFDYDRFKVDFAYTLDGDRPDAIEYENFNAASATVDVNGISVHPGTAKDKMVNALAVAFEFHSMMDPDAVPEKTEGYEGFNLLIGMEGEVGHAKMQYILRNHDMDLLQKQKHDFEIIRDKLNEKYGYEVIDLKLRNSYRNMKEKFIGHEEPIHLVEKAMKEVGLNFHAQAIRGGTDGAALTWNGVLCPNLGTGGGNFHGVHEYWCKEDGEKMVELVVKLLSLAKKA